MSTNSPQPSDHAKSVMASIRENADVAGVAAIAISREGSAKALISYRDGKHRLQLVPHIAGLSDEEINQQEFVETQFGKQSARALRDPVHLNDGTGRFVLRDLATIARSDVVSQLVENLLDEADAEADKHGARPPSQK